MEPIDRVKAFYIGTGTIRRLLFATMQAKLVVMKMPNLETYYIKRSPNVDHYVYTHHSMVSCHMVYREQAFDHFDSILCVGPHHIDEIREREKQIGLPAKELIKHGYGRLGKLLESANLLDKRPPRPANVPGRVLITPSWGENGLLERLGGNFIESFLCWLVWR
jgi:YidC/Oxa1 family membrane protein insertase